MSIYLLVHAYAHELEIHKYSYYLPARAARVLRTSHQKMDGFGQTTEHEKTIIPDRSDVEQILQSVTYEARTIAIGSPVE